MSGAPKGNKNAEKWTKKLATELLEKALALCDEKEEEVFKYDFIGEIACELGTFHQNLTVHLPDRFPELKDKSRLLKSYMERNCYFNTKKGNIKEATGLVNLKSNHQWTDRQQLDHTSKGERLSPINVTVDSSETAETLKKLRDGSKAD